MSDTGRYQFLSWARRGIGASVSNKDNGGALPARASVSVQLKVTVDGADAPRQPNAVPVQMFGPGDVVGIDPRHIIRTEPRPFTTNFEPNFLCGIEFDAPDLPVAVHSRRAERRPPAALARPHCPEAGRVHHSDERSESAAIHSGAKDRRPARPLRFVELGAHADQRQSHAGGRDGQRSRRRDLAPRLSAPARPRDALHRFSGSRLRDRQAGGLGFGYLHNRHRRSGLDRGHSCAARAARLLSV